MTKEEIHDEQIAPLMTQIIDVCEKHGISMLADFHLDDDRHCTSAIVPANGPEAMRRAVAILSEPESPMLFLTTTGPDGRVTKTAIQG